MSLRVGSSGDSVRSLQQRLQQAGFDPGGVDGEFGANTRAAVERFQQDKGLTPDGIAGSQTMRAFAGHSSFDPSAAGATAATGATPPTGTNGTGLDHNFKQFREVDEARLRAALPPQAQDLAPAFIAAGRANNIDPLTLVAISRHETANWTSSAFRNKNNAMGISNAHGPRRFSSPEASIQQMAHGLADPNGYYRNATTIRDLWSIYAPGPATGQRQQTNDPGNLNRSWGPGIAANLQRFERAVQ